MRILFLLVFGLSSLLRAAPNPCDGVTGWKQELCTFSQTKLVHFAWGYEHSVRDYLLAMQLAKGDGVTVDAEVLFAAAMLHDMGGFAPFEKAGVDHAVRSAELVEPILQAAGFPMGKVEGVKQAILTHSYYETVMPSTPEAIVLHDADTLDFLGAISAARLLSISGKEAFVPDPKKAIAVLTGFQADLPAKLHGGTFTQALGRQRAAELKTFLNLIQEETFTLGLPRH